MIYAPAQQIDTARNIARSAQRRIKNETGMRVSIMLHPVENMFETPEEMLEVIANTLGMSSRCYKMRIRTRDIVELRFIGALLLRMHFPKVTLTHIAVLFGGQDHTSILSGIARAHALIYSGDEKFTAKYNSVVVAFNKWLKDASVYTPAASA